MKFKICTKCYEKKVFAQYAIDGTHRDGISSRCKECVAESNRIYFKNNPWKRTYQDIKKRCYNINSYGYKYYGEKGIKCFITEEEIKYLWHRDNASKMKKPTIDRINSKDNYCLENCRYIELSENVKRVDKSSQEKIILQYNLDGTFIRAWKSTMEIKRILKFDHGYISKVCLGKCKQAYGFIWKHKKGK